MREMTFSERDRRCFRAWSSVSVRFCEAEGSEERIESMVFEI
jgi:hypothetical protein